LFVRNKDGDVSKALKALPKPATVDIIEKYKENFLELNGKEVTQDV